jgi:hypothetical protein
MSRAVTWATYAALLIVTAGIAFLAVRNAQQTADIACQSRYITALSGVLAERGALADQTSAANQALQESLNAAVLPSQTAARVTARKTYVSALQAADRERDAHPIPVAHC